MGGFVSGVRMSKAGTPGGNDGRARRLLFKRIQWGYLERGTANRGVGMAWGKFFFRKMWVMLGRWRRLKGRISEEKTLLVKEERRHLCGKKSRKGDQFLRKANGTLNSRAEPLSSKKIALSLGRNAGK